MGGARRVAAGGAFLALAILAAWHGCAEVPGGIEDEREPDSAAPPFDEPTARRRVVERARVELAEQPAREAAPAEPEAVLEVVVTASDGAPAEGRAIFVAADAGAAEVADEISDGVAELHVAAGVEGHVVVLGRRHAPWCSEATTPEVGRTTILARLDAGLAVEGRVFAYDGLTPAAGAEVATRSRTIAFEWPASLRQFGRRVVPTDERGRFRVEGLPAGTVELHVAKSPRHPEWGEHAYASVPGGSTGVRLVFRREVTVRFQPFDARTGRGLRTRYIEYFELPGPGGTVGIRFESRMPEDPEVGPPFPERPIVVLGPDPRRYRIRAHGYVDSDPIAIDPDEGDADRIVRVPMTPDPDGLAQLVLHVDTAGAAPPEEIGVLWYGPDRRGSVGSVEPLVDGTARLTVPPGEVVLGITARGAAPDRTAAGIFLPEDLELTVERGALVERRLVLRAGGRIRVRGPRGQDGSERPERLLDSGQPCSTRFQFGSDAESRYYLSDPLPPGTYELDFGADRRVGCDVFPHQVTEVRVPGE